MAASTQPSSAPRGSTVIDLSKSPPALASGAWLTLRRIVFTAKDLAAPQQLFDVLYKIQDLVFQGLQPVTSNPVLAGNLLRNVSFSGGQTQALPHYLSRPYQGWFPTRAVGNPAVFEEGALPSGMDASQVIPLTSTFTGTFDFYVF